MEYMMQYNNAKLSKADITCVTSPRGNPVVAVPKLQAFSLKAVIPHIFHDDTLIERTKNIINENYDEPYASQAVISLEKMRKEMLLTLCQRIASGNVKTAQWVRANVSDELFAPVAQKFHYTVNDSDDEEFGIISMAEGVKKFEDRYKRNDLWEWLTYILPDLR